MIVRILDCECDDNLRVCFELRTDDDDCETCPKILEKLETIDDDTDKHHIQFVKANDEKLAHEIGIFSFPALVYYETGVPIMYDGMNQFPSQLKITFGKCEISIRVMFQTSPNTLRIPCSNNLLLLLLFSHFLLLSSQVISRTKNASCSG